MKRLASVALLAALPAYAQQAPQPEVFARFSEWTRNVRPESGSAFIARAESSEPVGTQLAIKDAAGSDFHGVSIAIVGNDNQVRPLKAGFRTGERFKLRVLTTFAAHVVVENINARDERRQIYPAPSAGVVVVQSGGYVLLPLGAKEFFEFTKATGQELLVVSLSHPRAVGDAASRQPVLRVDEKAGTSFIQEVAKGKFPAILEPIRLEHRSSAPTWDNQHLNTPNPGATWFRRGHRSSAGHAEDQITSQIQSGNTTNANDERFALAA